jgi:RHS repeat-associated protein
LATDQRGPGFRRNVGGNIDIGAFESEGFPDEIVVNTVVDAHDATPLGDGIVDIDMSTPGRQVSLRAAIEEAEALAQLESRTYVIAFDPTLAGVIEVAALGTLTISSDMRIEGPGADRVILDGGNSVRLLSTGGAANLEISGLTLSGGYATGSHGGAILHGSTGTLTVESMVVTGNSADEYGGGIYTSQGPVHVIDSTLADNWAESGGAIGALASNGAYVAIEDSVLRDNRAVRVDSGGYGGGLYVFGTAGSSLETVTVDNATFDNNTALHGGAIFQSTGSASIVCSRFTENTAWHATAASWGGALYVENSLFTVNSSEFTHNTSKQGGAIYVSDGVVDLSGSTVARNDATTTGGGVCSVNSSVSVTNSAVNNNTSAVSAGGIYAVESTLDITDSEISGNESADVGGGVSLSATSLTVTQSEFKHNEAGSHGGGLSTSGGTLHLTGTVFEGNTSAASGGGAYLVGGTLDVAGSTFAENEAANAGGMYALVNDDDSLAIADSTFVENYAHVSGGGLFVTADAEDTLGEVSVLNSAFDSNRAASHGGGIFAVPGELDIVGVSVTNNVANEAGDGGVAGGIYVAGTGARSTSIVNSTISGNTAYSGGGVFVGGSGGVVTVTNCTVTDNDATGNATGSGGGIRNYGTSAVVLHNTLVAGNHADAAGFRDVRANATPFDASSSYNLIGFDPNPSITGLVNDLLPFDTHNQVGGQNGPAIGAQLAPLGNYGGRTLTHAPLADSPAIDKGSNSKIPTGITTDQRGYTRKVNFTGAGEIVDIGAVEMATTSTASRLEADFNGDGRLDSAVYESSSRSLVVSLNTDAGIRTGIWGVLPSGAWSNFRVGDFNGDGRDDIVARRAFTNALVVAISEGDQFQVLSVTDSWGGNILVPWTEFYVGDFDGDGSDEVTGWSTRAGASDRWEVLHFDERAGFRLDSGDSAWSNALRGQSVTGTITVGDVNCDGRDDLVAYNSSTSTWKVGLSGTLGATSAFVLRDLGTWFNGHVTGAPETGVVDVDGPYREFLEIFSEVYNAIELEFYPGLMKGIEATAETKAGNPWDQAALLVDRLEAAGFEADIASGQVRVPYDAAQQWTGTTSPAAAYAVIKGTLDGNATYTSTYIQFKHAWVRAKVPTTSGLAWVDLDPSWKFKDYQPGIDLSGLTSPQGIFNEFDYLAQEGNQLPVEYFEDKVMEYLVAHDENASLADVPYDGPIIQRQFSAIPVGLGEGVTTVGTPATYPNFQAIIDNPTWRDALTHRATISLERELVSESRAVNIDLPIDFEFGDDCPPGAVYVDLAASTLLEYDRGQENDDAPPAFVARQDFVTDLNPSGSGIQLNSSFQNFAVAIPGGYQITRDTHVRLDFNGLAHDDDYVCFGFDVNRTRQYLSNEYLEFISDVSWSTRAIDFDVPDDCIGTVATYFVFGHDGAHAPTFSNVIFYDNPADGSTSVRDDKSICQSGPDYASVTFGEGAYEVTSGTVLEVEFKPGTLGALHAVGWDVDNISLNDAVQPSTLYQLAGTTATPGYSTNYAVEPSEEGYNRYVIPIGSSLAADQVATLRRLVFHTDDGADVREPVSSWFRNISIGHVDVGTGGEHWSRDIVIPASSLDSVIVDYVVDVNSTATSLDDTYRSRLLIDGEVVAEGTADEVLQPGDRAKIRIQHQSPSEFGIAVSAGSADKTYTREPGQILAINFDANQYSREHIVGLQAGLNELLLDGDDVSDIDELLSYTGAKFWYDFNRSNQAIDGLLRTVGGQQWVGSGIVTADPSLFWISEEDVAHLQFPIVPYDMGVDLPNSTHSSIGVYSGSTYDEASQLASYNGSALENAILEEVINSESVSTIRGLQRAHDNIRGLRFDDTTISREAIQVFESVPNGSSRTVYFRGEIGDNVATTYDPTLTSQPRTRQQLLDYESGGLKNHVKEANRIADLLFQQNGQSGAVGAIRVLVPRSRSQLGDAADGWTGTVFVADYQTASGHPRLYIISPDDGTPTSGGYSSNVVTPENLNQPKGSYLNGAYAGDPVNVANGNMFRDELDFRFANAILPLDFGRHYDSQNNMDLGFGVGWTHSFTGIIYQESGQVGSSEERTWLRSNGERHTFVNEEYLLPATLFGQTAVTGSVGSKRLTEFRDKDGTRYYFDHGVFDDARSGKHVIGRLTSIGDTSGTIRLLITYESSTSTRVSKVQSSAVPGRYLEFVYDDPHNTVEVRRVEGGQVIGTWTYVMATGFAGGPGSSDARLVEVNRGEQNTVTTAYSYYTDGPNARKGLIRQITEPNGESHEYEYYASGRVFRVTDGEGHQQSYSYNLFRNLTEFTDERGNVETYIHQDNGLLERQVHPDRSRLAFTWGAEESHEEFLMKSSTDEVGAAETFTYYQPTEPHSYRTGEQAAYQNVYRPGELKQSVSKDGLVTQYQYWVSSNTSYQFRSELSKIIVDPGLAAITTTYESRDTYGNLTGVRDAEGNRTEYSYDSSGLLKSQTLPKGVEGDEAVTWQPLVDTFTVTGNTLSVQLLTSDVSGQYVIADAVRIDRMDEDGVMTRVVDDDPTGSTPGFRLHLGIFTAASGLSSSCYGGDRSWFYEASSEQVAASWIFADLLPGVYRVSAHWRPYSPYDPTTKYCIFDGLPRVGEPDYLATVDQTHATVGFDSYQTVYEYDTAGNVVAAVTEGLPSGQRVYDSYGNVVYEEDATGVATVYQYDVLGRLTSSYVANPTRIDFSQQTPVEYYVGGVAETGQTPHTSAAWSVEEEGRALEMVGNAWRAVTVPATTVTADTYLEFDYLSDGLGEIHGIGIDTNTNAESGTGYYLFKLGGVQSLGATMDEVLPAYESTQGWRHYRIRLADFEASDHSKIPADYSFTKLVFVNDDDRAASPDVTSRFANVVLYEADGVGEATFDYDASGLLLSSTDALGRTTANEYDDKGNLTKQTYADGTSVAYEYDEIGNRIATTDELGRTTRFIYDARNRLIQMIFADGSSSRTRYDGAGRAVESTDELGRTTTFAYDEAGRLLTTERELTYDGYAPVPVTETNQYDSLGRLTVAKDARLTTTFYEYDNLGRVVETRVVRNGGTVSSPGFLSTTSYDANGNAVEQVVYDVVGLKAPVADGGAGLTSIPDDPTPLISSHPQFVQRVATRYDVFGRPVEVTNADGTTTSTIYDAASRVRYAIDELGRRTELQYDEYGRLQRTIAPDPDGPGAQESAATRYERDAFGNVTHEWQYFGDYDGQENVEYANRFFYDQRNRVVTMFNKDDEHRTDVLFDVAGQVVATTDALGNTSYTRYDERDRAIQQRQPDPDGTGHEFAPVTTYEYDAAGNVSAMTDPLGNTTWFGYDSLNRLREEWANHTEIADNADTPGNDEFAANAEAGYWPDDTVAVYGRDITYWDSPTSPPLATWTFDDLTAGTYQVAMTWLADASYDNDATATIFVNGDQQGTTATINQRKAPADIQTIHGAHVLGWKVLNWNLTVEAGDTITVQLTGHTGEGLIADAVRLDRCVTRSYTYDNNGNLLTETDTLGRTTDYVYDGLGRQTSVKLPDPDGPSPDGPLGRPETKSSYDGYGNLIKSVDTRGTSTSTDDRTDKFEYDQRNRLTKETLDAGTATVTGQKIVTTYEYDAVGNRTLVTDALGHETHYRYDAADRLIDEYQDFGEGRPATPLQFSTDDVFAPYPGYQGTCAVSPDGLALTLTGDNFVCAAIDDYSVTRRTVLEFELQTDNFPRLAMIGYDNDDLAVQRYYELAGSISYANEYNAEFRQEVLPDGTVRFHIPIGQYLTDDEKATGLPITLLSFYTEEAPGLSEELRPTYTFSNIRLYESDEVRTVYTYDTRGNLETVRTASDPRNITTRYKYDLVGQRTHEILDYGGPAERTYVTEYDAVGNVVAERNQSAGTETTYEYDNLHRLVRTTLPDPDGDPETANGLVTTYAYDVVGSVIEERHGELESIFGSISYLESTYADYNELGLTVAEWDGNGDETRYRYDSEGNLLAVTDAENNATTYHYDLLGRVRQETNALGDSRNYQYDDQGNLFAMQDRNGRVRVFSYDAFDRRTMETWRNTEDVYEVINTLTWQYDRLGRVTRQVDGNDLDAGVVADQVNTFQYDGLGRLIAQTNYDPLVAPGSLPEIRQTYDYGFVYDADLRAFCDQVTRTQYARGDAGAEPIAQTLFEYDRLGQLEFESDTDADAAVGPDVAAKQASFRYDARGNLSRITRQGGERDGQWALQATTDFDYDDAGRLASIDHEFAPVFTPFLQTPPFGTSYEVNPVTSYTYAYDEASRITRQGMLCGTETIDSRNYEYDDAGQLTGYTADSDPQDGEYYVYDDAGNRLSGGEIFVGPYLPNTIGPANRVTDDGTSTYQYDDEGNLTRRTLNQDSSVWTEYAWDYRNRLTQAVDHTAAGYTSGTTYFYDASDQRVMRVVDPDGEGSQPPLTEYFVYDGDELAMTFASSDGAGETPVLTHRYLYGPQTDQVLADEVFAGAGSTGGSPVSDDVLWLLADHQGTVRDVIDSSGALRKHVDYDSFGKFSEKATPYTLGQHASEWYFDRQGVGITDPATHAEAVDQLFYYTGREWDAEAGLYNYHARWYDPEMGRFLSEDPSGIAGGDDANLYRYVGNSPLNFTDPTGLRQAGNPLYSLPSVTKPIANVAGRVYTAASNLWQNAGQIGGLANKVGTLTSQINAVNAQRNADLGLWDRWFGPTQSELNDQFNTLSGQRAMAKAQMRDLVETSLFGGDVNTDLVSNPGYTRNSITAAVGSGLATGGKAVVNAGAGTAVGLGTLGFVDYAGPLTVTNQDMANGYGASYVIARGSTELLAGVGTGALGAYGSIGKAVTAYDAAGNVVSVGRGSADIYNNGASFGNVAQVVGGGLGLGGNVAAGGRALSEIAQDAGRVRVSFDPATLSAGGLGGVKVHLNTNTATSNFGVYDIMVNNEVYKVGKADLNRVTQSTGLPTRVHQQVRKLKEVYGQGNVKPGPIADLGTTTTSQAKLAEVARLHDVYRQTGIVPPGNVKSFTP